VNGQNYSTISNPIEYLLPDSEILNTDEQQVLGDLFLASPEVYVREYANYQAELVYAHDISADDDDGAEFDAYRKATERYRNMIILVESAAGFKYGGFNKDNFSYITTGTYEERTRVENFVFSVSAMQRYSYSGELIGGTLLPSMIYEFEEFPSWNRNQTDFGQFLSFDDNWKTANNYCNSSSSYECPVDEGEDFTRVFLNGGISLVQGNTEFPNFIDNIGGRVEIWAMKDEGLSSRRPVDIGLDLNNDGIIDLTADCSAGDNDMFTGSQIFNAQSDNLISGWLPEEFHYKAELIFDINNGQPSNGIEEWLFYSEGRENTVIVIETVDGRKFGGFNSGFWNDTPGTQTGLLDNFIFSISGQSKHDAIPGEVHITNGTMGPKFGGGDIEFVGSIVNDVSLSYLGSSYECGVNGDTQNACIAYLASDEEYEIARFEFWQLKDSGTPVLAVTDENENGICDHLELTDLTALQCSGDYNGDGFVNIADLGGFLSAFGSECD